MSLLQISGLLKDFGGFHAVDGVDLSVEKGTIHALIGPNGAGKTTLFYLLAGYVRPTSGQIRFEGGEIGGLSPHLIARKGIICAFQITHIFPRLSVVDCVKSALIAHHRDGHRFWRPIGRLYHDRAMELLEDVGLSALAGQHAGTLSHGDQRVLEVLLALATTPHLLLLDEPTAGMSPVETERVTSLVKRLAKERGLTVLLVEHDVNVVFSVSDRVTVLHQGKILKEGSPADIRTDKDVIEVYLGSAA